MSMNKALIELVRAFFIKLASTGLDIVYELSRVSVTMREIRQEVSSRVVKHTLFSTWSSVKRPFAFLGGMLTLPFSRGKPRSPGLALNM